MDPNLPGVQEMRRQLQQGGDISLPIDVYVADIARTEVGDAIRPHVRMDAEGLSQIELQEATPQMENRIRQMMERADIEAQDVEAADTLTGQIFDQLMETGRVSRQVARMQSALIPAAVSARAKEYGVTFDEMAQRLGFGGVVGPEVAQAEDAMEQQPAELFDVAWPDDTEDGENPVTITAFVKDTPSEAFVFAEDNADGSYSIKESGLPEEMRGQGFGVGMYEALIDELVRRDQKITSDLTVSPEAQRVYEALRRRGYEVTQNPDAAIDEETGALYADDPVFDVVPPTDDTLQQSDVERLPDRMDMQQMIADGNRADLIKMAEKFIPASGDLFGPRSRAASTRVSRAS
jgi:predicted GNAT family acetyltransferase